MPNAPAGEHPEWPFVRHRIGTDVLHVNMMPFACVIFHRIGDSHETSRISASTVPIGGRVRTAFDVIELLGSVRHIGLLWRTEHASVLLNLTDRIEPDMTGQLHAVPIRRDTDGACHEMASAVCIGMRPFAEKRPMKCGYPTCDATVLTVQVVLPTLYTQFALREESGYFHSKELQFTICSQCTTVAEFAKLYTDPVQQFRRLHLYGNGYRLSTKDFIGRWKDARLVYRPEDDGEPDRRTRPNPHVTEPMVEWAKTHPSQCEIDGSIESINA